MNRIIRIVLILVVITMAAISATYTNRAMAAEYRTPNLDTAEVQLILYATELELVRAREALTMQLLLDEINSCRRELHDTNAKGSSPMIEEVVLLFDLEETP